MVSISPICRHVLKYNYKIARYKTDKAKASTKQPQPRKSHANRRLPIRGKLRSRRRKPHLIPSNIELRKKRLALLELLFKEKNEKKAQSSAMLKMVQMPSDSVTGELSPQLSPIVVRCPDKHWRQEVPPGVAHWRYRFGKMHSKLSGSPLRHMVQEKDSRRRNRRLWQEG
ncbi:hypothetical protein GQ44DRAFT_729568 [Phaeosphaeriaceae sp. PMI808]|nr:hypothetical protein GQ44DRAFT_729568 [Phaeosphaeriaceae sp. PMI808]